jgi:DNA-binding response OmpR family regulator
MISTSEASAGEVSAGVVCLVGPTATPEEQQLSTRLSDAGFTVCMARDVTAASEGAQVAPPDAMLLACHVGGVEAEASVAVQHLRAANFEGLIVVLSARWEPSYVVNVLNTGADDYVRCPYDPSEVVARLRVLARRAAGLTWLGPVGNVALDRLRRVVRCAGREVALTAKEAAVLACLSRTVGRVVPLEEIVARVWGAERNSDSMKNLVEVYVSYVRRKLHRINCPVRVLVVRGVGYRLGEAAVSCGVLASQYGAADRVIPLHVGTAPRHARPHA